MKKEITEWDREYYKGNLTHCLDVIEGIAQVMRDNNQTNNPRYFALAEFLNMSPKFSIEKGESK